NVQGAVFNEKKQQASTRNRCRKQSVRFVWCRSAVIAACRWGLRGRGRRLGISTYAYDILTAERADVKLVRVVRIGVYHSLFRSSPYRATAARRSKKNRAAPAEPRPWSEFPKRRGGARRCGFAL